MSGRIRRKMASTGPNMWWTDGTDTTSKPMVNLNEVRPGFLGSMQAADCFAHKARPTIRLQCLVIRSRGDLRWERCRVHMDIAHVHRAIGGELSPYTRGAGRHQGPRAPSDGSVPAPTVDHRPIGLGVQGVLDLEAFGIRRVDAITLLAQQPSVG